MMKRPGSFLLGLVMMGALVGWASPGQAMIATALEFTDGSVGYHGRFHRVLDRLLDQGGVVKMGEYQPIGDIVPSISRGRTTFSLFTSGFNGAPPPSATIDGSSISGDLSSLFLAVSRGESIQVWNIGGQAVGTFDPTTSHFTLSWKDAVPGAFGTEHSDFRPSWGRFMEEGWVSDRPHGPKGRFARWQNGRSPDASFILEGTAVVGEGPAPVPIPASQGLYVTGLLGLGVWAWFKQRQVEIM